jgi:hypothetical protein
MTRARGVRGGGGVGSVQDDPDDAERDLWNVALDPYCHCRSLDISAHCISTVRYNQLAVFREMKYLF